MQATEYHCERYRHLSNAEVWDQARGLNLRFKRLEWTDGLGRTMVLEEMRYAMLVLMDRLAAVDPAVAARENKER